MKRISTTLSNLLEAMESWKSVAISALFLAGSLVGFLTGSFWLEQLAWGSIILSGVPMAWEAIETLWEAKRITSGLLVSMAMAASLLIGETFAAGEIAFIMAIGELLEHGTVSRARRGLKRLLALAPAQGRRLSPDGKEETIPASSIRCGDLLRVAPGETIPTDGSIEAGRTSIDQSILTGESLPVERGIGESVYAGTLNGDGSIDIRATHDGQDSSLQRMIRLVQEAGERQAPIQREADLWAQWLVPASIAIALAGYVALRLLGYEQGEALLRAVTVLVVFCPCALALATPASIMAAIGQATKKGIIIKSGEALEALGRVDTLAFDKTGTLTLGQPAVASIHAYCASQEEVLRLAASLESRSEHPLGKAIASANKQPLENVTNFRALPGRGVKGDVSGRSLLCGNEACLAEAGIKLDEAPYATLQHLRSQGMATILVAEGPRLLGILGMQDTIRHNTQEILRSLGTLDKLLLTGDNMRAAKHFAAHLQLDAIHADLLPEEKSSLIKQLQRKGKRVAMVGDGVNDSPALKEASVGIAMSHLGSDIATEAADISLMQDDLSNLPYLMRLSQATLRTIRFNIAASLVINLGAIALSLMGVLNPVSGALVHNAGSLIVILNAAFLYDRKFA